MYGESVRYLAILVGRRKPYSLSTSANKYMKVIGLLGLGITLAYGTSGSCSEEAIPLDQEMLTIDLSITKMCLRKDYGLFKNLAICQSGKRFLPEGTNEYMESRPRVDPPLFTYRSSLSNLSAGTHGTVSVSVHFSYL